MGTLFGCSESWFNYQRNSRNRINNFHRRRITPGPLGGQIKIESRSQILFKKINKNHLLVFRRKKSTWLIIVDYLVVVIEQSSLIATRWLGILIVKETATTTANCAGSQSGCRRCTGSAGCYRWRGSCRFHKEQPQRFAVAGLWWWRGRTMKRNQQQLGDYNFPAHFSEYGELILFVLNALCLIFIAKSTKSVLLRLFSSW